MKGRVALKQAVIQASLGLLFCPRSGLGDPSLRRCLSRFTFYLGFSGNSGVELNAKGVVLMAVDSSAISSVLLASFPDDKSASLCVKELIDSGVPVKDIRVDWGEEAQPSSMPVQHPSVWNRIQHYLIEPGGSRHHAEYRRILVTISHHGQDSRVLSILRQREAEVSTSAYLQQ